MRLITRSDFDGIMVAVLLKQLGLTTDLMFIHPHEAQKASIKVSKNDILANLPYIPGVGLWFDHHSSEQERLKNNFQFQGRSQVAPSCARVVWEYYGGLERFPERFKAIMDYVDRCDNAQLTQDEIDNPQGWILLNFIMDPHTGLTNVPNPQVSYERLMVDMVEYCRTLPVEKILKLPDVKEYIGHYFENAKLYREILIQNSFVRGNVIILDLRQQEKICPGNRFLIYTLYPQCNVSLRLSWGSEKKKTIINLGHSIVNRTNKVDIGSLMLKYGGGGHYGVGSCQLAHDRVPLALKEMLEQLNGQGRGQTQRRV